MKLHKYRILLWFLMILIIHSLDVHAVLSTESPSVVEKDNDRIPKQTETKDSTGFDDPNVEPGILEALESDGDEEPGIEIRKILRKCRSPEQQAMQNSTHVQPAKCEKKIDISLRLINKGKFDGDVEYILVNTVHDELTGQIVYLYDPLIVQLHQEQVSVSYQLHYRQSVNSKPYEQVLSAANLVNFTGCVDPANAHSLCSSLADSPTYASGTNGYCCGCSKDEPEDDEDRRESVCDDPESDIDKDPRKHTSAHCLKFSPLWYALHTLSKPEVYHTVQVKIYKQLAGGQQNDVLIWKRIGNSDIVLGTERHSSKTKDGKVVGKYWSKATEIVDPGLDYTSDNLLIPEPIYTRNQREPDELKRGAHTFLVVDNEDISSDGSKCNKIGVSHQGFLSQKNKCEKVAQSCFKHQPKDLWLQDQEDDTDKDSHLLGEKVVLCSPGIRKDAETGHEAIHVMYDDMFIDIVDLHITADSFKFVFPGDSVEILQVTTSHPVKNQKAGMLELSVLVMNTGSVTSNFTIQLADCQPLMLVGLSEELSLDPHQTEKVSFHLGHHKNNEQYMNNTCAVQVLNVTQKIVASMDIWFVLEERCHCTVYCKCQCGTLGDVKCHSVTEQELSMAGYIKPVEVWTIQVNHKFLGMNHKAIMVAIVITVLLVLSFIKALVGFIASPGVGMFGFALCFPASKGIQPSRCKLFVMNLFFFLLGPFLLVFSISQLVALIITLQKPPAVEQQPLLPKKKWSDILDPVKDFPSNPDPIVNTSMENSTIAETLKKYMDHKDDAKNNADEMENHDAAENPFSNKRGEETQDISVFLELGQMVFCNYSEPHPGLINSGAFFSLCGQLSTVNSDLFKFSIELNQTQVYENQTGDVKSLINLYPLQAEQFSQVLTHDEVLQRISVKPRHPCLNKVL